MRGSPSRLVAGAPAATWAVLGASLVVGLAALVRIADPIATSADGGGSVIRLPPWVPAALGLLFGLATLVFLAGVVLHTRTKRPPDDEDFGSGIDPARRSPWLRTLAQLGSLANFLILAYLIAKNILPLRELFGEAGGAAGSVAAEPPPSAPFLITWTFAGLALAAGCAALVFAVWFTSAGRLANWFERDDEDLDPAPPPLAEAVDESLEDVRDEPDARRAITRCYARFERAAAASGLERRVWQTPSEFMAAVLSHLPAPPRAVRALTVLFELARFSDRPLGTAERDHALDALDDIKAAVDARRRNAIPR